MSDAPGEAPPALELVRGAASPELLGDWSLVLTAVGIPHEIDALGLFAPPEHAEAARAVLATYEAENAQPSAPPHPPIYGETLVGAVLSLVIVAAFAAQDLVGPRWQELGEADSVRIRAGELWRTATALTLHADAAHSGGNALFGGVALTALAHRLGPAGAAWIGLVSGVLGNTLTALLPGGQHLSIGASTAVFGMLGALAGAQLVGPRAPRRWISLGAGAALLALLGTGARADLFAHFFGMLTGLILGVVGAALLPKPPARSWRQPLAAAVPLVVLAAAWWRAIR